MAFSPIAFIAPNYRDFKNYWLKAYQPGTTTPKVMALDSEGVVTVAKLELNKDGFIESAGGAIVTPYITGAYDAWLFPTEAEADANDTSNAERVADDLSAGFINDLSQTYDFPDGVPEYKAFSSEFPVGKRIYLADRDAYFNVIAGTGTANTFDIIASTEVDQSISMIIGDTLSIDKLGGKFDASDEKDVVSRFFELLNSTVRHGIIQPLSIATSISHAITRSDVTLEWSEDGHLKAFAAMNSQIVIGDGSQRKQSIHLVNPHLLGNNLANFGIEDVGTRISSIKGGIFHDHLEYHILQEPTTVDFSEFLEIKENQGNDARGFFIHKATTIGRATDTVLEDNVMFRATDWFAKITSGQRFKFDRNMIGRQSATFLGGILITASDLHTGNETAEHIINDLYVESNVTYGAGIEAVVIENQSTTRPVNGCVISNIKVEPVTLVKQVGIRTPAAGGSRQHTIKSMDPKGGFADSIKIGTSVAWTRITVDGQDANAEDFINDAGNNTVINGLMYEAAGAGGTPTTGTEGDTIVNTSDNSTWLKVSGGYQRLSYDEITFSDTFNAPSIAAGGTHTTSFVVTGAVARDTPLVTLETNMMGLMLTSYTRTDALHIILFNPTVGAVDLGSTTLRAVVMKT